MEKHEKLAKLYLTLIAIIGITIGYLDTKEIDFIYLIVCGIGMLGGWDCSGNHMSDSLARRNLSL